MATPNELLRGALPKPEQTFCTKQPYTCVELPRLGLTLLRNKYEHIFDWSSQRVGQLRLRIEDSAWGQSSGSGRVSRPLSARDTADFTSSLYFSEIRLPTSQKRSGQKSRNSQIQEVSHALADFAPVESDSGVGEIKTKQRAAANVPVLMFSPNMRPIYQFIASLNSRTI